MLSAALLVISAFFPNEGWIPSGWAVRTPPAARAVVRVDPVEARLVRGETLNPAQPTPEMPWRAVKAGTDGWLEGPEFAGGYALAQVTEPTARVALLEAPGSSLVYVNDEIRVGDPYQYGTLRLPVALRAGENTLLASVGRGRLRWRLSPPPAPVFIEAGDATLPDVTPHVRDLGWGAVIVVNAAAAPLTGLSITARRDGGRPVTSSTGSIGPLTLRKLGFRIGGGKGVGLEVVVRQGRRELARRRFTMDVRPAGQAYRRTFVSDQDGSVQYYAVLPSTRPGPNQALFLSLHGASVEAIGQAQAYAPKSWGTIIAPTNRRPYGFDWEEVGRRDALEALDHATRELLPDPRRIYLTGHSMGGHGTWHLGAIDPDRFAAIAPSAGWISFFSYAGGRRQPTANAVGAILNRAANLSDTPLMAENLGRGSTYVLHGVDDDNVPVEQARQMRTLLAPFNPDLKWHEEPGAGHWWDNGPEPGAACLDWPALFDFFAARQRPLPREVRRVVFTTVNPGASSRMAWAEIVQQSRALEPSRIDLIADPHRRWITGTTGNVRRLRLDPVALMPGGSINLSLDGDPRPLTVAKPGPINLIREGATWRVVDEVFPSERTPARAGGIKDVLRNRVLFLVGTQGTPEESAWAEGLARYLAETLLYRGNGSVDIYRDTEISPADVSGRNVLVLGHTEMVRGFAGWVGASPVAANRGELSLNNEKQAGDFAAAWARPRPGEAVASATVLAGTGPQGRRLTERIGLMAPGVGLPDFLVWDARLPAEGLPGVVAAGFFSPDWQWSPAEVAQRAF